MGKPITDFPTDTEFHYLRLEVTVEAALVTPEDHVLGDNLVDATVAFGWRIVAPPPGVTDAAINAALTERMTGVLALVQSALLLNGWVVMGQPDERMGKSARETGEISHTTPITVRVVVPDERSAVHD
jgi:hypothetical protein